MIRASADRVGEKDAKRLLENFDTVERVLTASIEELKSINKIGDKKAERIKETITHSFNKNKPSIDEKYKEIKQKKDHIFDEEYKNEILQQTAEKKKIINLIKSNGKIHIIKIANRLNIEISTLREYLQDLELQGMIYQEEAGYWDVFI